MAKQKNIAERQGKAIESILRLSKCKMGSNITRKKNKNWTKMGFAPTEKTTVNQGKEEKATWTSFGKK